MQDGQTILRDTDHLNPRCSTLDHQDSLDIIVTGQDEGAIDLPDQALQEGAAATEYDGLAEDIPEPPATLVMSQFQTNLSVVWVCSSSSYNTQQMLCNIRASIWRGC